MLGRKFLKKLAKDTHGVTLVYVSLIMALLIGMAGTALDFSRLYIADTQAQAAADAAAIAAANQLDGSTNAITRATAAAQSAAALVENSQHFAEGSNSSGEVSVTLRFLTALPTSDDLPVDPFVTTDPQVAEFVEVTTEVLTHNNIFLPALGISRSLDLRAVSVAGQDSAICRVTPLAICNPAETVGGNEPFNFNDWVGKQIRVKQSGPNSAWAPGNFGYLDPPNGSQGAPEIASMLASVDGADQCFSTALDTRTGQIGSAREALNTRFDMYENPFFGNDSGNDDYPPAVNVTKGWTAVAPGNGNGNAPPDPCNVEYDENDTTVMGLPRDNVFTDFAGTSGGRFGDGNWDCLAYWELNHPDDAAAPPPDCSNNSNAMTRYEMYRYEIDNNVIPGAATGHTAEEGTPQCYSGTPFPFDEATDRRLIQFAVMNCIAEGVGGNSDDVPALKFVRAFITEPVDGVNFNVYLEVVDVVEVGERNGVLKEYVEIFR